MFHRPETLQQKRRTAQTTANEYKLPIHIYRESGSPERYLAFSNTSAAPTSCTFVETVEPE